MNKLESIQKQIIEKMLDSHYIGRIACSEGNKPYIVPITYCYDNDTNCIISHSGEGKKIEMLRRNPLVCFEMEEIKDINNWQSVIAWGYFEELHGPDARNALHKLVERLRTFFQDDNHSHIKSLQEMSHSKVSEGKHIVYRIRLNEITGRKQEEK
jgi:uncharacterized protein